MGKLGNMRDAQNVIVAVELARLGATRQVIQRRTGFGHCWTRRIINENNEDGSGYRRRSDPARWFAREPDRILHGSYIVKAYLANKPIAHPGDRLRRTYLTYQRMVDAPVLDINVADEIIELYTTGMAWERTCADCGQVHLVVSDFSRCPVCRRVEAMLCKGCGGALPERSGVERRGRPRLYCGRCESNCSARVLSGSGGFRLRSVI